jgi:bifunctional DNase/RNase
MVEMELNKIIIDEKRHDQIIVLKEKNSDKLLPIVIGINEASAIKMKLSNIAPPRPLTHDLVKSIMDSLDAKLESVVIDKIEDNTFFAKLSIKDSSGQIKIIDSRPSDSIALALRSDAKIFVEEDVLKNSQVNNKNI